MSEQTYTDQDTLTKLLTIVEQPDGAEAENGIERYQLSEIEVAAIAMDRIIYKCADVNSPWCEINEQGVTWDSTTGVMLDAFITRDGRARLATFHAMRWQEQEFNGNLGAKMELLVRVDGWEDDSDNQRYMDSLRAYQISFYNEQEQGYSRPVVVEANLEVQQRELSGHHGAEAYGQAKEPFGEKDMRAIEPKDHADLFGILRAVQNKLSMPIQPLTSSQMFDVYAE